MCLIVNYANQQFRFNNGIAKWKQKKDETGQKTNFIDNNVESHTLAQEKKRENIK